MNKNKIIIFGIILLSFAVSFYFYDKTPDVLASHWDTSGQVNGYMPKIWGLFLMPIISLVIVLFFLLIPKLDPLKENIAKFRNYFDGFIVLILLFLFYMHLLTIFWNIGKSFDITQMMMPALGLLFYYCGVLVSRAKRNWFVGIRTPWTLNSDGVWDKTHKIGGMLFKVSGLIAFLGFFWPSCAVFFIVVPVIFTSFFAMIYSYFEYKKESGQK